MDNSFFLLLDKETNLELEKVHICFWEFKNNSAMMEFGAEITNPLKLAQDEIEIRIYVPWISRKHRINDLYEKLKDSENCKFVFNDSISGTTFLDGGSAKDGVIQNFTGRSPLCILPLKSNIDQDRRSIAVRLDIRPLKSQTPERQVNVYFRFSVEVKPILLSIRKNGINKSSIIYDFKINEKRNLPDSYGVDFQNMIFPKILACFCINILPNTYDLTYFDNISLKNIRTLEHESFMKYLSDKRVKANEYLVVFHKRTCQNSYGFFSVFTKERIGTGQFALAILANILCGILLFLPGFRKEGHLEPFSSLFWAKLPIEVYASITIGFAIVLYFFWPRVSQLSSFLYRKATGSDKND